jgi:hypothetical protein
MGEVKAGEVAASGEGGKEKPAGRVVMAQERFAMLLLGIGFFSFGAIAGCVTGLSSWNGISNTLLTSLFTFVGGSLLGFGGFVLGLRGDVAYVSGRRLGLGLLAFSIGVALGLYAGTRIRLDYGPPLIGADGKPQRDSLLHGDRQAVCDTVRDKLDTDAYGGVHAQDELRRDLAWLARSSCPAATSVGSSR